MRIYHNSRKIEYRNPFGAVCPEDMVTLRLKLQPDAGEECLSAEDVNEVTLRLWRDEKGETLVPMQRAEGQDCGGGELLYEARIEMPQETGILWYYFIADVGGNRYYYGNNNNNTGGEGCMSDMQPSSYQITVYRYAQVPSWYKDAIVYQIFPDRFARDENWRVRCGTAMAESEGRNGQKRFTEEDWYKPAYYVKDHEGNVTGWPFYGGSLRGIEEKLDYLVSMGVGAIYLNPIFSAASNHRYDTADYMKIDSVLGDEEDFRHLARAAEERGIRLILDGVFSHVGADSIYFDRFGNYGGKGAYGSEDSEYRSWFDFSNEHPAGYRSWWGIKDLPEVNEEEEGFRQLICGENGVLAKWLRAGASGWRLDVADELPDSFITEIRHTIKKESPDNLLLGEVWEDASNKMSYGTRRQYLMGDELDSTMNYPLRDLLIDFVLFRKGAWETGDRLMSLAENYPGENFYGALNLIGSHDRARIMNVMGAESNYDMAALRVGMMALLQYSLPGVPCVYYGDEAAMMGDTDPDNRCGFIWGRENKGMQNYFRQLGVIYHEHPVLKDGSLSMIDTGSDNVLGFIREDDTEKMLILVNRENHEITVPAAKLESIRAGYALELLSSGEMEVSAGRISCDIIMSPLESRIICIRDSAPKTMDMKRCAGVICHIGSLPGGTIGKPARDFVDYIASAGLSIWQILPLNPPGIGDSPYSSHAAMAGNPGFIDRSELPEMDGYDKFCADNDEWLSVYAAYAAGDDETAIEDIKKDQYYFDVQWERLKEYANSRGIMIMGDLPAFVSAYSADTEADRTLFMMDSECHLKCHAGVPPDYFAENGQDWGNPLYNWRQMKKDGYRWWTQRLAQCFRRYDYVRLDHFRSFSEYYSIPEGESPVNGMWQPGPGLDFFKKVSENLGEEGCLRIMAEDLGQLDAGVYNLLKLCGFPGMNVYQFSGDEMMSMTPGEIRRRVFYTGTHDNQTLLGWCRDKGKDEGDALAIIRSLYESDAPWVMMQIQDMFMLGDEARLNVPGVAEGNWKWKIPGDSIKDGIKHADKIAAAFRSLARETGRLGGNPAGKHLDEHGISADRIDGAQLANQMRDYYEYKIATGEIKGVTDTYAIGDRRVIAVDMGGTNTRVARVRIENGRGIVEKQVRVRTPGRDGSVTVEELFLRIAKLVETVDRDGSCDRIGFSFSFPGEPAGRDMRIIRWDKEIKVEGGSGLLAGRMLQDALAMIGQPHRDVTVANDSVTAFFAGKCLSEQDGVPCAAAFILGTGTNICFLDNNDDMIYNLEAGDYPGFPMGEYDMMIDGESDNQGRQLAEKMMGGEYLGRLIRLISEDMINRSMISTSLDSESDRQILEGIEAGCMNRAELFSAVMISSAVVLGGYGPGEYKVIVEGSTFWKTPGFSSMTLRYAARMLEDRNIKIDFVKMPDAGLIGAAAMA